MIFGSMFYILKLNLNLRVQQNLNIEKIIFKVVQIKFLAMHINNKKFSFHIFTVDISSWNMILISNDFWH